MKWRNVYPLILVLVTSVAYGATQPSNVGFTEKIFEFSGFVIVDQEKGTIEIVSADNINNVLKDKPERFYCEQNHLISNGERFKYENDGKVGYAEIHNITRFHNNLDFFNRVYLLQRERLHNSKIKLTILNPIETIHSGCFTKGKVYTTAQKKSELGGILKEYFHNYIKKKFKK